MLHLLAFNDVSYTILTNLCALPISVMHHIHIILYILYITVS